MQIGGHIHSAEHLKQKTPNNLLSGCGERLKCLDTQSGSVRANPAQYAVRMTRAHGTGLTLKAKVSQKATLLSAPQVTS